MRLVVTHFEVSKAFTVSDAVRDAEPRGEPVVPWRPDGG